MNILIKTKDKIKKYQKPLTITLSSLLALGFVGSVIGAIFSGGEFSRIEEVEPVKEFLD